MLPARRMRSLSFRRIRYIGKEWSECRENQRNHAGIPDARNWWKDATVKNTPRSMRATGQELPGAVTTAGGGKQGQDI